MIAPRTLRAGAIVPLEEVVNGQQQNAGARFPFSRRENIQKVISVRNRMSG